jgi:hypothetical protein
VAWKILALVIFPVTELRVGVVELEISQIHVMVKMHVIMLDITMEVLETSLILAMATMRVVMLVMLEVSETSRILAMPTRLASGLLKSRGQFMVLVILQVLAMHSMHVPLLGLAVAGVQIGLMLIVHRIRMGALGI